jgi:hypothetical protein
VDRLRAPPLLLFAAASLAIHLGALDLSGRAGAARAPRFEGTSAPLLGDTLEVEPGPLHFSEGAGEGQAEKSPPVGEAASEKAPTASARGRATPAPAIGPVHPTLFGAAGTRYATDLATTLTQAFPQAASADPVWLQVPFGPAGSADLVVVIDEDGHISDTSIGGAPSGALRRGIERTLSLLMLRSFTAHAPVTRVRLTARVSHNDVHDGLHGDVFALNRGRFSGDVGTAFFALPPGDGTAGRRVDIELRLMP